MLKRHEDTRLSHVAIVFRNLVLQNQMVAKGVPGQFRDKAMILMRIFAVMSEDQIRGDILLQYSSKTAFTSAPTKRHEPVRKVFQQRTLQAGAGKQHRATLRLRLPHTQGAEHDPVKVAVRILLGQPRMVPPQPISISSEWEPRHRICSASASRASRFR